ncbi:MAG: sigma factor [Propionibacteriaceae bacterium]
MTGKAVATAPIATETELGRDDAFGGTKLLGELLVASGRHDQAAFARFYQLTSPWIFDLMRRRTGSIAPAEDATRLVYVTSWRRAASFAPVDQSALAWLTAIAYDLLGATRRDAFRLG